MTADPKQTLRYRLAESLCHREDQIVRQEQAKATQDVTLGAGYQRLQGVKYNALLVSVSVPLPFSNRNEAGILSAERMASSCRMKLSHEELQIKTLLNNLGARRRTLENERQELDRSLLPGARKSLEQTRSAFVLGKASFLEIADAQKSMIALKVRSLEIQKELSDTLFEAESLFGKH